VDGILWLLALNLMAAELEEGLGREAYVSANGDSAMG
jgi:hypothetical protein